MLQIAHIRENTQEVIKALEKKKFKNAKQILEDILKYDVDRRELQNQADSLLAQSNVLAKSIGELIKSGKKEEAEASKLDTTKLKEEIKRIQELQVDAEAKMNSLLITLPNTPHQTVPEGNGASENVLVFSHEKTIKLPANSVPHWELIKKYNIIDFELGTKISGAGFPVYKGQGARLQRGLINFFLEEATKEGYTEIQPPIVVNQDSGFGPVSYRIKKDKCITLGNEDLYLIPTAEVPITNLYRNEIIPIEQLPIKNVGYTPCFRREAGSWGAHVRGLNRLHQFDKVEIVQIRKPEESYQTLEEMVEYVKGLFNETRTTLPNCQIMWW